MMDEEKRKEILKKLVLSEEDTLEKFEELIDKSRDLFAIDEKNNNIIFKIKNFTNAEKISLFFIGKFFSKEIGLSKESEFSFRDISEAIDIKSSTLSAPLGILIESGYVSKKDNLYSIKHYKIEEILDSLIVKYRDHRITEPTGLAMNYKKSKKINRISMKEKKSVNKIKAKKVVTEKFETHGNDNTPSLENFINEKKPDTSGETILVIGYYITEFLKKEEFTEGNTEFAYKLLKLPKRPVHLHQAHLDTKNQKFWLENGSDKNNWIISREGEIFIEQKMVNRSK